MSVIVDNEIIQSIKKICNKRQLPNSFSGGYIVIDNLDETEKINQLKKIQDLHDVIDVLYEVQLAAYYHHTEVIKWLACNGYNIKIINGLVNYFSIHCNIDMLQWLLDNDLFGNYNDDAIDKIANNKDSDKRIACLNWWTKSGLELKYSSRLLRSAAMHDYVNIFQWIFDNGIEINIDLDSKDGDYYSVELIEWFISHDMKIPWQVVIDNSYCYDDQLMNKIYKHCLDTNQEFEYSEYALCMASWSGNMQILNWWSNSGLELLYNLKIIDYVISACSIDVIKWWLDSGLNFECDKQKITNTAISTGNVSVLNLLLDHQLITLHEIQCHDQICIENISNQNSTEMLNWLHENKIDLCCSEKTIDNASTKNNLNILNWWLNSGYTLKYSRSSMDYIKSKHAIQVLNWWMNSGLELKYSIESIDWSDCDYVVSLLKWWIQSGLEIKYTCNIIDKLSRCCNFDALEWIFDESLTEKKIIIKYCENAFDFFRNNGDCSELIIRMINLWLNHEAIPPSDHEFIIKSIKKFAEFNANDTISDAFE